MRFKISYIIMSRQSIQLHCIILCTNCALIDFFARNILNSTEVNEHDEEDKTNSKVSKNYN